MSRRLLRAWRVAGALAIAIVLAGHVGTNDAFFAGPIGPWNVRVSIRQPGVIPGLADISVRVAEPGVERVTVTARQTRTGGGQAPPPDVAQPVRGEETLFAAQLWLMNRGPHEVIVTVDGDAGHGMTRIPIVAVATKQLEMARDLELFVLAGGLFLVVGLLTIVGAASRESVLSAGEQPARADQHRALRATAVAAVVIALVLVGGWRWVQAESEAHRRNLDRPWSSEATMRVESGQRILELAITEPMWMNRGNAAWLARNNRYQRADLVPDHGKMMHMFIVRDGSMDAFAHVHPVRLDNNRFAVAFPPLPAGRYRIYADIAHEDGLSHTLSASVEVGPQAQNDSLSAPVDGKPPADTASAPVEGDASAPPASALAPDPDDAWWVAGAGGLGGANAGASPVPATEAAGAAGTAAAAAATTEATRTAGTGTRRDAASVSPLPDGSVLRWLNAGEPLIAGTDADLVFRVQDADGNAVALDPYMGMRGHAMLSRDDGAVFVHLHPSGMISMAAQSALNAASGGITDTAAHPGHGRAEQETPGIAAGEVPRIAPGIGMAQSGSTTAPTDGAITFPLVVPDAGTYRIWVQVRRGDRVLTGFFDAEVRPAT